MKCNAPVPLTDLEWLFWAPIQLQKMIFFIQFIFFTLPELHMITLTSTHFIFIFIDLPPLLKLQGDTLVVSFLTLLRKVGIYKLASLHLPSRTWGHLIGRWYLFYLASLFYLHSILLLELLGIHPFSAFLYHTFSICGYSSCLWRWEHWNGGLTVTSPKTAPSFFPILLCVGTLFVWSLWKARPTISCISITPNHYFIFHQSTLWLNYSPCYLSSLALLCFPSLHKNVLIR